MKSDNNTWRITLVTVLLVFLILGSFGIIGLKNYSIGGMMNWMFGSGFAFMWIFMLIIPILLTAALVLLILWFLKQLQFSGGKNHGKKR